MAEFHALHKYLAILIVLVAIHEFVITHGRQIKPLNLNRNFNGVTTSTEKIVESPSTPNSHVAGVGDTSAFRPTTPGNSPGVGHRKFEGEDEDMKAKVVVKSPDVKYSLTESSKTEFKPTDPGHSPGVGHDAHHNKND